MLTTFHLEALPHSLCLPIVRTVDFTTHCCSDYQELDVLQTGPAALLRGTEDQMRQLRKRLGKFSQLQLLVQGEQLLGALQHAAQLKAHMKTDAEKVLEFATQGVFLHQPVLLRRITSADDLVTSGGFAPVWSR